MILVVMLLNHVTLSVPLQFSHSANKTKIMNSRVVQKDPNVTVLNDKADGVSKLTSCLWSVPHFL